MQRHYHSNDGDFDMKQFFKWCLVVAITTVLIRYTYSPLASVFKSISYFMTIHLSFPDWLGDFLGGTFHTGVYVLFVWWFSGILALIPSIREFIKRYGWFVFVISWFGISATIIIALIVLFAMFIISLLGDAWSEPQSVSAKVDNCVYDPTSDNLRKQYEERRQREENEARMRGAQRNYDSAMRGGNYAQASNFKQDMENIAAKMK